MFREIVHGGGAVLAVVMAVNTVIGLFYYIAWTARLFTPEAVAGFIPTPTVPPGPAGRRAFSWPVAIAIGVALVISVAFSVAPQLVLSPWADAPRPGPGNV